MSWLARRRSADLGNNKKTLGEGVFRRCDQCGTTLQAIEFSANHEVCPSCGHHFRLSGEGWLALLLDPGSWREVDRGLKPGDPLGFRDSKRYADRVSASTSSSGVSEAFMAGSGRLDSRPVQLGLFLFRFMGGSMGSVVGEKVTRLFERGAERREPVILISSSGGARMQEGLLSLMQMAKTVSALGRLRAAGVPYISVLLNPTTGGVAASFSLLGDINIAEPNALVGFAGPRVIESTIREKLPEGFQRSEFLREHGFIDLIAKRHEMRSVIARLLGHLLD